MLNQLCGDMADDTKYPQFVIVDDYYLDYIVNYLDIQKN